MNALHSTDLRKKLDQTPAYQSALERVLDLMSSSDSRIVIAIAGIPGSGKSTFADYLSDRINQHHPQKAVSVSMDGFHLSKAQLQESPDPVAAFARRGAPWTFNSADFVEHLAHFKQFPSTPLGWPSFDHAEGDPIRNATIISPSVNVLIVEGLYVLHQSHGFERAAPHFDHRWFIALEMEQAMRQLAARHQQAWGISNEEALQRIATNDALNAEIVDQSKQHADYILSIK